MAHSHFVTGSHHRRQALAMKPHLFAGASQRSSEMMSVRSNLKKLRAAGSPMKQFAIVIRPSTDLLVKSICYRELLMKNHGLIY